MISKDKQTYTYLPESVEEFPSPERFSEILQSVGFRRVRRRSQSFGIAYIYEALK
jgi:demethylmenaquinone methyltransferase/2-methoxy-6-polyprenyl-1,4-benzoquinol methylase